MSRKRERDEDEMEGMGDGDRSVSNTNPNTNTNSMTTAGEERGKRQKTLDGAGKSTVDRDALKAKLAARKAALAAKINTKLAGTNTAGSALVAEGGKDALKAKLAARKAALAAKVAAKLGGPNPSSSSSTTTTSTTSSTTTSSTATTPPKTEDPRLRAQVRQKQWGGRRRKRRGAFKFLPKGARVARGERRRVMEAKDLVPGAVNPRGYTAYYGGLGEGGEEEWWDRGVEVDGLVEHPVPIPPPVRPGKNDNVIVTRKTAKEQRKLKQRKKKAEQEEEAIKIRLGLIKPPPPKLKLSNMMRVLGMEAVADPTAVEARVRAEVQARVDEHFATNEARKLTPEQKAAKHAEKRKEDTSQHVQIAVFRVEYLEPMVWRYALFNTARTYNLTGVLLRGKFNVVIVEGGPKGIKRFIRLMTVRTQWNNTDLVEEDTQHRAKMREEEEAKGVPEADRTPAQSNLDADAIAANVCTLVWKGWARRRSFNAFSYDSKGPGTLVSARKLLSLRSCEFYLDVASQLGLGPRTNSSNSS